MSFDAAAVEVAELQPEQVVVVEVRLVDLRALVPIELGNEGREVDARQLPLLVHTPRRQPARKKACRCGDGPPRRVERSREWSRPVSVTGASRRTARPGVIPEFVAVVLPSSDARDDRQLAVAGVAGQLLGAFEELRPVPWCCQSPSPPMATSLPYTWSSRISAASSSSRRIASSSVPGAPGWSGAKEGTASDRIRRAGRGPGPRRR